MSVPNSTLFDCISVFNITSPLPSKVTEPATTSPVILKFLAVANMVAVSALPVRSPVTPPLATIDCAKVATPDTFKSSSSV